jgi:glycosyltransferase involved in cell wall biosynthesis
VTAPLVSVVIPAYNAASTLPETLESVFCQTYPHVEIVVVNDGSRDGSRALLDGYGARLRAIHKPNGGLASSRNAGIAAARGELIAILDADDLCAPERLAVQASVMARFPEVGLGSSGFSAFGEEVSDDFGPRYYSRIAESEGGLADLYPSKERLTVDVGGAASSVAVDVYHGSVYEELVHGNFVHPPTMMFRRRLYEAAGRFDETLSTTSDWEWIVRAARLEPFAHVARSLLRYRLSPGQMSRGGNPTRGALEILRVLERNCDNDAALFARDRRALRRRLAAFSLDAAYALAEEAHAPALRMLARSAAYGTGDRLMWGKILVKALLPRRLRAHLRRGQGAA